MMTDDADREQVLHDKAIRQLKKQRDFRNLMRLSQVLNRLLSDDLRGAFLVLPVILAEHGLD